MTREWSSIIQGQLEQPFKESEVSWVIVATTNKNKPDQRDCWAPYIDADSIIDRLEEVCGPGSWSSELQVAGERAVVCRLTIMGVTRTGVGECAKDSFQQPLKAASTDAFKRAASLFGVGRYLHKVRKEWRAPTAGRPRTGQPPGQSAGHEKDRPATTPATNSRTPEATRASPSVPQSAPVNGPKRSPGQEAFGEVLANRGISAEEACGLLNAHTGKTTKERLSALITEIKARKQCDSDTAWKEAAARLSEAYFATISEEPIETEVEDAIS